MNRLVRGSIMFVAAAGAWACKTNLGENADTTDHLVATPSVILVANTDSQSVDVEALNPQGEQLAATFSITDGGTGIVVRQDTSFLPVTGGHSAVRARFVVRAATVGTFTSTSFTISANGKSVTVPVAITPANFPGIFSTATPNVNDTIVVTAPAPLTFSSGSGATFGAINAYVVSIAPDSSSMSIQLPPGTSGFGTFTGLRLPYLASNLSLLATTDISVPNSSPFTGTDALATAPTVAVPATSGETRSFFDTGSWGGTCSGAPCQWYKIVVAAAGDINFGSDWDNTSDLGIYVVASNGTTGIGACDAHGDGATAKPEACTITFPSAGTYYIQMQNFAPFYPDPDPTWFQITMQAP